jgi:hypothetical protein
MDQAEKCAIPSYLTRIFTTGVTDTASLNMASSKNDNKQSAPVCERDSMMTQVLITWRVSEFLVICLVPNSMELSNSSFLPGSSSLLQLSQNKNSNYGRLDYCRNYTSLPSRYMPGGPKLSNCSWLWGGRTSLVGRTAATLYSTCKITPVLCC